MPRCGPLSAIYERTSLRKLGTPLASSAATRSKCFGPQSFHEAGFDKYRSAASTPLLHATTSTLDLPVSSVTRRIAFDRLIAWLKLSPWNEPNVTAYAQNPSA